MTSLDAPLAWSAQLSVSPTSGNLSGDKISLPPKALEQLLAAAPTLTVPSAVASRSENTSFDPYNPYTYANERQARSLLRTEQQQLPHPLTFRLVNPVNGRAIYAGIREFSAVDDQVRLSAFLLEALDIPSAQGTKDESREIILDGETEETKPNGHSLPLVTVHAKQLSKGKFAKLRPLEAGYNPEDWKSLLEEHLRKNFTTLTKGEILSIGVGRNESFQFLVDELKPEHDGICIVDTDLEIDIEALNEEQARETLRRIIQKKQKAPGTESGSSVGGELNIFKPLSEERILEDEYVDYELASWPRTQGLEFEVNAGDAGDQLDLLVSPFSPRQRARPREEEHVFADFQDRPSKRIRLSPTNVELEKAETLYVSIHATPVGAQASPIPIKYSIRATVFEPNEPHHTECDQSPTPAPGPDETICPNCHHAIPTATLTLHATFCARNNILCPKGCGQVFQWRSPTYTNHWHCTEPNCTSHGSTSTSHQKHARLFHTPIPTCPACSNTPSNPFPSSIHLSRHLTTTCPSKLILCRFCHLSVPQESPFSLSEIDNALLLSSDLTPHEAADGARTTDCDVCSPSRPVRLRDMDVHMRHHEYERLRRPAPRVCRNPICGRTVDGVTRDGKTRASNSNGTIPTAGSSNGCDGPALGLCAVCFGPLYTGSYDPDGKQLKRRVERRLLQQVMVGCGRGWCRNVSCCRTAMRNASMSKGGDNNRGNNGDDAEGGGGGGGGGGGEKDTKIGIREALPRVKPFVDGLFSAPTSSSNKRPTTTTTTTTRTTTTTQTRPPLPFCTDDPTQLRRELAESLAATEGVGRPGVRRYEVGWWLGGLEAEAGDVSKARGWVGRFGVGVGEVS